MRVIRSLQRHNNIPLLPPLTEVYKQFPFMYNQSVASGPSLVSDIYGLPLVRPGCRVPTWIKRRHRYLKKLSPAARNTLLTGDPFFAFDNTAYDSEWPPSLLPQAPCHRARPKFLLRRMLSYLRSLLFSSIRLSSLASSSPVF
jgi:hypothetical protein